MKQYIDKSVLIAEIQRRIKECGKLADAAADNNLSNTQQANELLIRQYTSLLHFLDTLETKEVDLGQEIKNRIDSLCNLYCYMEDLFDGKEEEGVYPIPEKVTNELFEFAKYFFELGLQKAM